MNNNCIIFFSDLFTPVPNLFHKRTSGIVFFSGNANGFSRIAQCGRIALIG